MSDTPRTDAEALNFGRILCTWGPKAGSSTEIIPSDFARQLERELEQARAELKEVGCPIGLYETPEICSAGTCNKCLESRLKEAQESLKVANMVNTLGEHEGKRYSAILRRAEAAEAKNAELAAQVAWLASRLHPGESIEGLPAEAEKLVQDMNVMRGLLLWALYHHQGGSSDVGQPIRLALEFGEYEHLTAEQIELAKRTVRDLRGEQ